MLKSCPFEIIGTCVLWRERMMRFIVWKESLELRFFTERILIDPCIIVLKGSEKGKGVKPCMKR